MFRARTLRIALATLLFFSLTFFNGKRCSADEAATKAAQELARKLAAQIDHKLKLQVAVADLTGTMRVPDLDELKKSIAAELHSKGVRVVSDNSQDGSVQVTLSKNLSGLLWVAVYSLDGKESAVMVPFELNGVDLKQWLTGVHLDRELIFIDNSPILDFGCSGAGTSCDTLVLHPGGVTFMAYEPKLPTAIVPHEKAWPRDTRGRLTMAGSDFEVNLGDMACSGNVKQIRAMKCSPSGNRQWIFSGSRSANTTALIANNQNWFEWTSTVGSNAAQPKRPSAYSIAGLEVNGEPGWVASGLDGRARIFTDKNSEPVGAASGWGSDLATVKSGCGAGWQILATRPGDRTEMDVITAYEWAGSEFRAVSDPMEMDGPIVAMWSAQGGGPARVVVRNLRSGNYEAYFIKAGCSR